MLSLETIILGNTVLSYVHSIIIFIGLLLAFKIFQYFILRKLQKIARKTKTDIDDTLVGIIKNLKPPFYYFFAFYLASYSIIVSALIKNVMKGILIILIVYQIVITVQILTNYILNKKLAKDSGNEEETNFAIGVIGKVIKFIIWAVGLLLVLSNLGVNITSLIAGLGVGGIAIAFAMQNILEDLFSSLAIFFDKPFRIGDFIVIGTDAGTVKKVGIKTTRIQTIQGEELVISNKELTSSRIHNYKKMAKRRVMFSFGVTYNTPVFKLKTIPNLVKDTIESVGDLTFGRAHFKDFGDSSLNFEIIYFVSSSDYDQFMDVQQKINLKIMEKFEQEGIEMAYPTRTVFVKKEA